MQNTLISYTMSRSLPFQHEFKLKFQHFHTSGDGRVFDNVNTLETFNAYRYRIYKWDFFCYNFHIFRFSSFRFSGKGEVDAYRMCMFFIVSIPCHGIWSSRHQGVSPPGSFATNQHATKKPSRHQPTRCQVK